MGLKSYNDVDKQLNEPQMTPSKTRKYLKKIIKDAQTTRNQLKGLKSQVSQTYTKGKINKATKDMKYVRIDKANEVVGNYINHYKQKLQTTGSGQQRGKGVVFFNDPNQLLKKLEFIVGEIVAGNTSIKMRNMGVNILDKLLKTATINPSQYGKLYKKYFPI